MARKFENRPSRLTGQLLATSCVVFTAGLGIAAIASLGGADPRWGLLIVFVAVALVILLGFAISQFGSAGVSSVYDWVRSRDARPANEYVPELIEQRRKYGTNRPPSVEDVKELKGGLHNWVPSNVPSPHRARRNRVR